MSMTLLAAVVRHAAAVPASPDVIEVVQPDGASFSARVMGDEFQGWVETEQGYSVVKDKRTGIWEYAELDEGGMLRPSGTRVDKRVSPPPDAPLHIKPKRDLKREKKFFERVIKMAAKPPKEKKKQDEAKPAKGGVQQPAYAEGGSFQPAGSDPGTYWNPYPVSGSRNVLIVLVGFADRELVTTPAGWNRTTFSASPWNKSVANFYADNSFGSLTVNPAAHTQAGSPPGIIEVTLASNHPDYGGNATYAAETAWLNEALALASSYVDFPSYDTDSSGVFDNSELIVYFVTAGYETAGSAKSPGIWAHAWGGDGVTAGGIGLARWAMNGELNDAGFQHPMGVIAHELGHSMCGLPDLYDTNYINMGLGAFSVMAGGSWGKSATDVSSASTPVAMDAWCRQYLGWSAPREPSSGEVVFGPALDTQDAPAKLVNSALSTTEYFLAENRYPTGWDEGMELWLGDDWGGGLLVIHVDIAVGNSSNDGTPGANDINRYVYGQHQGVMAEEASREHGSLFLGSSHGHVTHLFYEGNNADFTGGTYPASTLYDGTQTGLGIYSVSPRGRYMTASLEPDPALPVSAIADPSSGAYLTGSSYTVTGTASDGSGDGISAVEVSTDAGKTWSTAADASGTGSWSNWSYDWTLPADGTYLLVSRATDNSGRVEAPVSSFSVTVDNQAPVVSASPQGKTYLAMQWVKLTSDKTSTIHYTTDGTDPDSGSPVYLGPLLVSSSMELRFFAVTGGGNSSAVESEVYTIERLAEWTTQMGGADSDGVYDIDRDSGGNLIVAGYTYGDFDGGVSAGSTDVIASKIDQNGGGVWSRQLGTTGYDLAYGVSADTGGNVYVAGYTDGAFAGYSSAGGYDMMVAKLDSGGNVLWTRQLGSPEDDYAMDVVSDQSGNVYVCGYTYGDLDGQANSGITDIFVVKYDSGGNKLWTLVTGSAQDDWAYCMDTDDSGNVLVGGETWGELDGNISSSGYYDGFVMKVNPSGTDIWTTQFGDGHWSPVNGLGHDAYGNVFAAGNTIGNVGDGYSRQGSDEDLYVVKLDSTGTLQWAEQAGTSLDDYAQDVAADTSGNLYLSGYTRGSMDLNGSTGYYDIIVMKYRDDGTPLWTRQMGSPGYDYGNAIAVDPGGGVYACGNTWGDLDGNLCAGSKDVFAMKMDNSLPMSVIYDPADGAVVNRQSCVVSGAADDRTGTGVTLVEVSTDGGASWAAASGTSNWSYNWSVSAPGTYNIRSRASDGLGNVELPRAGVTVTSGNPTLSSALTSPADGAFINISAITITGVSSETGGSGISTVELTTDGGTTWADATDTSGGGSWSTWSYAWQIPGDGSYSLGSRAVDSSANVESPYELIGVTVDYLTPITAALPAGGTYQSAQWVSLVANEQATTYYTTDGSAPDTSSPVYTSPILVSADTTLRFLSVDAYGHAETARTEQYLVSVEPLWTRQFGTFRNERANAVVSDSNGNVYVVGNTSGGLDGNTPYGNDDMFLAKYDASGNRIWTRQIGSSSRDNAKCVAVDGSGFIYVAGNTDGSFDGHPRPGLTDIFVVKYDQGGNKQWSVQKGTARYEDTEGLAVDDYGSIYVSGNTSGSLGGLPNQGTYDAFLIKLATDGSVVWQRQFGTSDYEYGGAVAVGPSGELFVAGRTFGALDGQTRYGNYDVFLAKYGSDGTMAWAVQYGGAQNDFGESVAADAQGNAYVAGFTNGTLYTGGFLGGLDAFVMKFDYSGNVLWVRQDGSSMNDKAYSVSMADNATVYLAGYTSGSVDGVTNAGLADAMVLRYRTDGLRIGSMQAGTMSSDEANGIFATASGEVYVAGYTGGELDGNTAYGLDDFFLMKLGMSAPVSSIIDPHDTGAIRGPSYTVSGSAVEHGGPGISVVEVSTDGGATWSDASDTSGDGSWSTWSFSWTPPADGTYVLMSRATDLDSVAEDPGAGISVAVDNAAPTSHVVIPLDGWHISGVSYNVIIAFDGTGSGVRSLEISTDGGNTWNQTYTPYTWLLPLSGSYNLVTRATDEAGNIEPPGPGITVTVDRYGSPELVHYYWDASLSGGDCAACHSAASTFTSEGFMDEPGFCASCHNAAGTAHEMSGYGARSHSVLASVTSAGIRYPTYGNITSGEYDNRPFARLLGGDKVVCVTCHNTMQKQEDFGRTWEGTSTSDYTTYTLSRGGWSGQGYIVPKVYRSYSEWTNPPYSPTYTRDKKTYLVDPSEYAYDESNGTVTFKDAQDPLLHVYVSLEYPYLRASSEENRLCADCHTQATHESLNCLTCHGVHDTGNRAGIRELLRTPARLELPVRFTSYSGAGSFADDGQDRDGICEVCHTATRYYLRDGSGFMNHSGGVNHDGADCTACHSHSGGFALSP